MKAPRNARKRGRRYLCALALAIALVPAGARIVDTQTLSTVTPPSWVGTYTASGGGGLLAIGNTVLTPDPVSTQEELPGLGHKFQLFGVMVKDHDPENLASGSGAQGGGVGGNETISATMTPTSFALAYRDLGSGIKIAALENQLGLKYYFDMRTCGGGSPRVTLLVDADADGDSDFAAHGHVGLPPSYATCPQNTWIYEDLTDANLRWEITPAGAVPSITVSFPFATWQALEAAITADFPNHRILAGFLVEDSCSFFLAACGKAYYDLLTIENRTLEIWQDAVH